MVDGESPLCLVMGIFFVYVLADPIIFRIVKQVEHDLGEPLDFLGDSRY